MRPRDEMNLSQAMRKARRWEATAKVAGITGHVSFVLGGVSCAAWYAGRLLNQPEVASPGMLVAMGAATLTLTAHMVEDRRKAAAEAVCVRALNHGLHEIAVNEHTNDWPDFDALSMYDPTPSEDSE